MRIYSVQEIQQMIYDGFSEEFQCYLTNAPDNVKDIINRWIENPPAIHKERYSDNETIEDKADSQDEVANSEGESAKEKRKRELILEYSNAQFEQDGSILVSGFYIAITNKAICPVHNTPLDKVQIVVPGHDGKNYGMKANMCIECRKIYMSEKNVKKVVPILEGHELFYVIEGEETDESKK